MSSFSVSLTDPLILQAGTPHAACWRRFVTGETVQQPGTQSVEVAACAAGQCQADRQSVHLTESSDTRRLYVRECVLCGLGLGGPFDQRDCLREVL
jgi:hypothetical protein